jgi:hypothetical protein
MEDRMKEWKPKTDGTIAADWVDLVSDDGFWSVEAKWDGCCHITIHEAVSADGIAMESERDEYIHICYLDDFIDRLVKLREYCQRHFNNEEWKANVR